MSVLASWHRQYVKSLARPPGGQALARCSIVSCSALLIFFPLHFQFSTIIRFSAYTSRPRQDGQALSQTFFCQKVIHKSWPMWEISAASVRPEILARRTKLANQAVNRAKNIKGRLEISCSWRFLRTTTLKLKIRHCRLLHPAQVSYQPGSHGSIVHFIWPSPQTQSFCQYETENSRYVPSLSFSWRASHKQCASASACGQRNDTASAWAPFSSAPLHVVGRPFSCEAFGQNWKHRWMQAHKNIILKHCPRTPQSGVWPTDIRWLFFTKKKHTHECKSTSNGCRARDILQNLPWASDQLMWAVVLSRVNRSSRRRMHRHQNAMQMHSIRIQNSIRAPASNCHEYMRCQQSRKAHVHQRSYGMRILFVRIRKTASAPSPRRQSQSSCQDIQECTSTHPVTSYLQYVRMH